MLLKTFFITDLITYPSGIEKASLPYNAHFCFKISVNDEGKLKTFLKLLYSSSLRTPFSLCFNLDKLNIQWINDSIFDLILLITFHYKYLNFEFNTPVYYFIGQNNNKQARNFADKLRAECEKQGYADVDFISIDSCETIPQGELATDLKEQIRSNYRQALLSAQSTDHNFFICLRSPDNLAGIIDCLQQEEKVFSSNNPQLFSLLSHLSDSERMKNLSQLNSSVLAQRLDSIQNYNSLHNPSEAEASKKISQIMEHYTKEYEILPTWYKRFGHIIKVIMGKRTFRSLFNDNVKKYKD